MSKIHKWCQLAIETRCEDIVRRRDTVEHARHERDHALKLDNLRKEKYQKELAERIAVFEESVDADIAKKMAEAKALKENQDEGDDEVEEIQYQRPQFDERDFKSEFDMANLAIMIPPEVAEEIDNDFDLPYSAPPPHFEWLFHKNLSQ